MTVQSIGRTRAGIVGRAAVLLLLLARATTAQEPAETLEAAPAVDAAEDETVSEARLAWLSGSLRIEADAAWDDADSDFDLEQTLHLNVTPPNHHRLRFSAALWLREDLDSDAPGSSALRDINDAYDADIRPRLLHLHAEVDDLWGNSILRIGRQRVLDGPAFNRIDGLYFKQYRAKWDWYVFAGARASLYEDSHNDFVYGGGASYRHGSRTRIAVDAYRADEHRDPEDVVRRGFAPRLLGLSFPRTVRRELDDTMLSASLWQQLTDNLRFFGRYTYNHDAGDELYLNLTGYNPRWDVTYNVSYQRQFNRVADRVNDLTVYYRILGPQEAYDHLLFSVQKPLTEKLVLGIEAEAHDSNQGAWNSASRDYVRLAAILSKEDLFRPGIDASIALERWNPSGEEGLWAVTGELSKQWKQFELTFGADYEAYRDEYSQYNPAPYYLNRLLVSALPGVYPGYMPLVRLFDTARVQTREDIYSLYAEADWQFRSNQRVRTKVSYEDDEGPASPYWRIQAGYEIEF